MSIGKTNMQIYFKNASKDDQLENLPSTLKNSMVDILFENWFENIGSKNSNSEIAFVRGLSLKYSD